MTWQPDAIPQGSGDPQDFFNVRDAQGHLLLVRIQDEVVKFATRDCPDGMKLLMRGPNKGKSVPNNVVRATIADLTLPNPNDSQPGKIYDEAVIFAGTLVKDFKKAVGKTLLLVWKQGDPSDKSSPYGYELYNENQAAVETAQQFLGRHPEFMEIPAPGPYVIQAREEYHPPQQAPQQNWGPQGQWQQGPPPQQWQQQGGWQQGPSSPEQRHGYQPQQTYPQQGQWQQQGPPQQPQPDPWNQISQQVQQAAPPQQWQQNPADPYANPNYVQHPPQNQGGRGSFLERSQAVNHHGQPQSDQPPY